MARDELNLEENMMRGSGEATNQSNKAFEAIQSQLRALES